MLLRTFFPHVQVGSCPGRFMHKDSLCVFMESVWSVGPLGCPCSSAEGENVLGKGYQEVGLEALLQQRMSLCDSQIIMFLFSLLKTFCPLVKSIIFHFSHFIHCLSPSFSLSPHTHVQSHWWELLQVLLSVLKPAICSSTMTDKPTCSEDIKKWLCTV